MLPIVTKLPTVPFTANPLDPEKVVVVPAVKMNEVGCTVFVILVNEFEPVIVSAPAPPLFKFTKKGIPAEAKVLGEADVNDTVAVPV